MIGPSGISRDAFYLIFILLYFIVLMLLSANVENYSATCMQDFSFLSCKHKNTLKKSRIRETSNLSTDADRRNDTIFERLHD